MTELTDFLDTEYGLQRGEDAWRASAVEAGKALRNDLKVDSEHLRQQLVGDRGFRLMAVKQWLRFARKDQQVLPGAAMTSGFRVVGGFALIAGLLFGIGAGRAALSSPSGEPVNLWLCLGMLVLLQLGLLLGALVLALVAKARGGQWLGAFTNLLKWMHRWSWAKRVHASEMLQAMPRTQKVERWIWLGLTQRFAVFFNVGALLIFAEMLLFSELQFGWSTTPASIEASHMQGLVDFLAAPWGWAFPETWVPNTRVIEATQWNSLAGSFYVPGADGRAWWPFVMMNLLVWGLLPRLLLMQWASNSRAKELRCLDWNHRRLQDLFDVMLPASAKPTVAEQAPTTTPPVNPSFSSSDQLTMVSWGDWQSSLPHHAGGRDLQADSDVVAELTELKAQSLQILVEAGEAPDKRFTSFVLKLRAALGRSCLIQVCPIDVSSGAQWQAANDRDFMIWRRTLGDLRDDHLHVSAMVPQQRFDGGDCGG